MVRKLFRSKTDRIIAGVCGGIAEYLQIDSTIVRLLWLIASSIYGSGIAIYFIAWMAIPEE